MLDRYYCIKSFSHLKTLEKMLRKVHFCITIMARKAWRIRRFWKHLFQSNDLRHSNVTKVRCFYAHYCWWRQVLLHPRMRIYRVQKPSIDSTWIAWLIHGILSVKTWLLIACDMAFYTIISSLSHNWTLTSSYVFYFFQTANIKNMLIRLCACVV